MQASSYNGIILRQTILFRYTDLLYRFLIHSFGILFGKHFRIFQENSITFDHIVNKLANFCIYLLLQIEWQ